MRDQFNLEPSTGAAVITEAVNTPAPAEPARLAPPVCMAFLVDKSRMSKGRPMLAGENML